MVAIFDGPVDVVKRKTLKPCVRSSVTADAQSMPFEAPPFARWLHDILQNIALAQSFVGKPDRAAFCADTLRVYGVTRCLEIISEAYADIVPHTDPRIRIDLDHDVCITVRPRIPAGARAEQRGMRHPPSPQCRLVLPQPSNDVLTVHAALIATSRIATSATEPIATPPAAVPRGQVRAGPVPPAAAPPPPPLPPSWPHAPPRLPPRPAAWHVPPP
jgi:hypothetical protein